MSNVREPTRMPEDFLAMEAGPKFEENLRKPSGLDTGFQYYSIFLFCSTTICLLK